MDEFFHRAERFLKAIAVRSNRAREALFEDDWERYEEAMKWRSAAFHHFRAADHVLQGRYPDYLKQERWRELWQDVQTSEAALAAQIEEYQSNLNQTLMKIRKTKMAVGRYRSGQKQEAEFEDGV